MEIPSPPPPTTTTTTVKTLDPDDPIQPDIIHDPKQLPPPFTNGVLKRHKPLHHHHHHHTPPPVVVTYKECLKNHAASMGGHALDGCGEFMPSLTSVPTDPTSIKCAACGCHRNFHRRDPDGPYLNSPPVHQQHVIEYQPLHRHHPPPPRPISVAGASPEEESPSPPPISSSYYPPNMLLALSSTLSAPPPEVTHNPPVPISGGGAGAVGSNSSGIKRFRTKFTQDQKQKMQELAERVGWKMQRKDEELITGFCNEIGVEKGVFKVWMHNNKMTAGGRKDSGGQQRVDSGSSGGGVDFFMNRNGDQQQRQLNDGGGGSVSSGGGGGGGNVIGTNGSSSSS